QANADNPSTYDIHAKLFDADHHQVNDEITVSSNSDDETDPDVAMDQNGNFVVVWNRNVGNAGTTGEADYALFDSSGNHIRVDGNSVSTVAGDTVGAIVRVGRSDDGRFVVSYEAPDANGNRDVFAQHFDSTGDPSGGPIPVAVKPSRDE